MRMSKKLIVHVTVYKNTACMMHMGNMTKVNAFVKLTPFANETDNLGLCISHINHELSRTLCQLDRTCRQS